MTAGFAGSGHAVEVVDIEIHAGECVGLVGESGSGKSVTALSILRLLPRGRGIIEGGSIVWRGGSVPVDLARLPLDCMPPWRGGEIAMVFQEPMTCLNPVVRVGRQIAEAACLHTGVSRGEASRRAIGLLEEVGIHEPALVARRHPHQLSGGMLQRTMIAMALACEPKLLLCDEPTTALDVTTQAQILELIDRLRRTRDMAVLFITHDLGVVARIADRVAILCPGATLSRLGTRSEGGRIVESGPVGDVFDAPAHPYTRGLLACRPSLSTPRHRLPTIADYLSPDQPDQPDPTRPLPDSRASNSRGPILLALEDLRTWFGEGRNVIRAVDGVTLAVRRGATLGLVGESGCGKSTLGRTALLLHRPQKGRVVFDGSEVVGDRRRLRKYRKRAQIVFQDPYSSLNPHQTVGSAIMEPMSIHGLGSGRGERRNRAADLLHRVGLEPDHLQRYPGEFSGGQRQRVAIARALAVEPEFIVLDECVSSLDVSVQAEVLNLLMDLQQELGLTYLFISHDLAVVRHVSDEVAVMCTDRILEELGAKPDGSGHRGGHIVENREAEELFESPEHPYTRRLLAAVHHA